MRLEILDYELGSNDFNRAMSLDLSELSAECVVDVICDCVCAGEVVLFYLLLSTPLVQQVEKTKLHEAFLYACTGGEICYVRALLDFGLDPNFSNQADETPLSSAAAWGHDGIVEFLQRHGAKLRSENISGNEELVLLISNCSVSTVSDFLVDTGLFRSEAQKNAVSKLAVELGRNDVAKIFDDPDV